MLEFTHRLGGPYERATMLVIGLTGGIGTGKSAASRILQQFGAEVIDADKVGHEAYLPGTGTWREVVQAFGEGILGDAEEIDREKLATVVFSDSEALRRLNTILHPRMYNMIEKRLSELRGQGIKVVVLEAALLLEANWVSLVDEVWLVTTPKDVVLARLRGRDRFDERSAKARIGVQMGDTERNEFATIVIENNGTLGELERSITALWNERVTRCQENRNR